MSYDYEKLTKIAKESLRTLITSIDDEELYDAIQTTTEWGGLEFWDKHGEAIKNEMRELLEEVAK